MRPMLPRDLLFLTGVLSFGICTVQSVKITNDPTTLLNRNFDFIVVGGGTAGLTVANRLTEDKHTTVLVIEAGNDLRNDTRITDPGMFETTDISDISWGYATTNQTVGGNQQVIVAGKVLGGSSAINGMQWTRGTAGQYDALEELGNEGWNFKSMQKYMKKAEAFHVPNTNQTALGVVFDPAAHGKNGNIDAGFPNPYPCPACKLWDALINSTAKVFPGIRTEGDVDMCSGDPRGVSRSIYSILPAGTKGATQNTRSSSAQGFVYSLAPGERPNLFILTGHLANKIVWKTNSRLQPPTPKGVVFEALTNSSSESFVAQVAKEVIVTCGGLASPKFLQLSGIGDRKLLENFDIPVVVDLPSVGTNVQDQAGVMTFFNVTDALDGPPGHTSAVGGAAFITLPQLLGPATAADYLMTLESSISERAKKIISSGSAVSQKGLEKMLAIQARQFGQEDAPIAEVVYLNFPTMKLVGSFSWILIPQYRGTVHIGSSDPRVLPIVNPNYLTVPEDLSLLVNISLSHRRIYSPPAVKRFLDTEITPGPSVQSDADFTAYVKNTFSTVLHPIGSLSMLPREIGGVVDSQLRVYGVHGVRVADASILPIQISSHLSSTVYGIAEKASDIIRGIKEN